MDDSHFSGAHPADKHIHHEPAETQESALPLKHVESTDLAGDQPASDCSVLAAGPSGKSRERLTGTVGHGTIDVPTVSQLDPAPRLPSDVLFPVILGCEVMYEMAHARWVAAALAARLQHGGKAVIAGAIRDRSVRNLSVHVRCCWLRGDMYLAARASVTVQPLIFESLWAGKRVSTGALRALNDPLVVQAKI